MFLLWRTKVKGRREGGYASFLLHWSWIWSWSSHGRCSWNRTKLHLLQCIAWAMEGYLYHPATVIDVVTTLICLWFQWCICYYGISLYPQLYTYVWVSWWMELILYVCVFIMYIQQWSTHWNIQCHSSSKKDKHVCLWFIHAIPSSGNGMKIL